MRRVCRVTAPRSQRSWAALSAAAPACRTHQASLEGAYRPYQSERHFPARSAFPLSRPGREGRALASPRCGCGGRGSERAAVSRARTWPTRRLRA
eukprot:scaffold4140_cov225-Prasinococcus_capsulatus_cf.AAC.1